jgi:hypothetical protein
MTRTGSGSITPNILTVNSMNRVKRGSYILIFDSSDLLTISRRLLALLFKESKLKVDSSVVESTVTVQAPVSLCGTTCYGKFLQSLFVLAAIIQTDVHCALCNVQNRKCWQFSGHAIIMLTWFCSLRIMGNIQAIVSSHIEVSVQVALQFEWKQSEYSTRWYNSLASHYLIASVSSKAYSCRTLPLLAVH